MSEKLAVEEIIDALVKININTYFIVTGGAIAPFVDAVGRSNKVKYYCFQHEQAAAIAAEGYYRASNNIAVVLVTSGPGVQNILNGVCGCWYDSIPCIYISGQVNINESLASISSSPRQLGFQETPVEGMFSSCTKYCKKINSIDDIYNVFNNGINTMLSDRKGPILIDFPVNLQMSKIDKSFDFVINNSIKNYSVDTTGIDNLLLNSQRPILIIGNGARFNNEKLETWVNRMGIPFVTSWAGIDLIEHSNPLRIGSIGVYGDRIANFCVQNADLLIILGSRMDTRQIGGNPQLCSTYSKKIMIDIDKEEINKLNERGFNIDLPIYSTVEYFINNYKNYSKSYKNWLDIINDWKNKIGNELERENSIYDILKNIKIPDNAIIVCDTGATLVWVMQSIKIKKGQQLFSNLGNSSMGYALPAAIGASIATDKTRPIISISGDGGIQMNIQELLTVSSLNLPITVIIINNSGYGIIRQFQDAYFNSRYTATNSNDLFNKNDLDFVKIGHAYNIESYRTIDNINISDTTPILYDIPIDPAQKIYPKLEFGNSLENMYPYRDNLHSYMIVKPHPPIIRSGWIIK